MPRCFSVPFIQCLYLSGTSGWPVNTVCWHVWHGTGRSKGEACIYVKSADALVLGFSPAVLVVIGMVAVLIGLLPRYQQIAWVIPIYAILSICLGGLLDFPEWTKRLTPFGWINKVPLKAVQWDQAGGWFS